MNTLIYKNLEETIITGGERSYVFVVREDLKGKERTRAFFLVRLVEKYKYSAQAIQLDVPISGFNSADLVVFEDSLPYIVIECEQENTSKIEIKQAQQELISKTRALKARYGVLVVGKKRKVFDITQPKQILDLPVKVA